MARVRLRMFGNAADLQSPRRLQRAGDYCTKILPRRYIRRVDRRGPTVARSVVLEVT